MFYIFKLDYAQVGSAIVPFDLGSYFSDINNLTIIDAELRANLAKFIEANPEAKQATGLITYIFAAHQSNLFTHIYLRFSYISAAPCLGDMAMKFFHQYYSDIAEKLVYLRTLDKLRDKDCSDSLVIEYGASEDGTLPTPKHYPLILRERLTEICEKPPYVMASSLVETLAVTDKYWYRLLADMQRPKLWRNDKDFPVADEFSLYVAKPISMCGGYGVIIGTQEQIKRKAEDGTVYILEPYIASERNQKRCLGRTTFCIYKNATGQYAVKVLQASWLLADINEQIVGSKNATSVIGLHPGELYILRNQLHALFSPFLMSLDKFKAHSLEQLQALEHDPTRQQLIRAQMSASPFADIYSGQLERPFFTYHQQTVSFRKGFNEYEIPSKIVPCINNLVTNRQDGLRIESLPVIKAACSKADASEQSYEEYRQALKILLRVGLIATLNAQASYLARYYLDELSLMLQDQPNDELRLTMQLNAMRCHFLLGRKKPLLEVAQTIKAEQKQRRITNKAEAMSMLFQCQQFAKSTKADRVVKVSTDESGAVRTLPWL